MSISSKANKDTEQIVGEKLAKIIARSGICSRRDAEKYICAGRVKINHQTMNNPAHRAMRDEHITLDDKEISHDATSLWLFHKPIGTLTSRKDHNNRPTIFECDAIYSLEKNNKKLLNVGRLDMNSEGLLLLSNDGELKRYLEMSNMKRLYKVRYFGQLDNQKVNMLASGATIDNIHYQPAILRALPSSQGNNRWLEMTLTEGKNREIRKMITWCGGDVNRLIRVEFGQFRLDDLKNGEVQKVPDAICQKYLSGFFNKNGT